MRGDSLCSGQEFHPAFHDLLRVCLGCHFSFEFFDFFGTQIHGILLILKTLIVVVAVVAYCHVFETVCQIFLGHCRGNDYIMDFSFLSLATRVISRIRFIADPFILAIFIENSWERKMKKIWII